jgi:hypothetical protein
MIFNGQIISFDIIYIYYYITKNIQKLGLLHMSSLKRGNETSPQQFN